MQLPEGGDKEAQNLNYSQIKLETMNFNEPQNPQSNIGAVSSRLSSADELELQKCKDEPVYFYNKYFRKDGMKKLTKKEYTDFVKQYEHQGTMLWRSRICYKDRLLLLSNCYDKLPDFLKNGH